MSTSSVLSGRPATSGEGGFTLVEVVVAAALFIAILLITGASFETILKNSTRLLKSEESNIEGLVGLELLRYDLEQAGLGLLWGFAGDSVSYEETTSSPGRNFNAVSGSVPCAVSIGNDLSSASDPSVPEEMVQGSDYLVIRGTTVGKTKAGRRWTYLHYSSGTKAPRAWAAGNIPENAGIIMLRRRFASGGVTNDLVKKKTADGSESFAFAFKKNGMAIPAEAGGMKTDTFFIYGVDDESTLRMPFNRSDYYVKRMDTTPASCAPHTGTLSKGVVDQGGGRISAVPLLDCVADMQVVLGWDMDGDGSVDTLSGADGRFTSGGEAEQVVAALADPVAVRERLKLIKVYVLAQDGARDPAYVSPRQTYLVGDEGEASLTRTVDLAQAIGADWSHYRWKLYRVVVHPKNLSGRWH